MTQKILALALFALTFGCGGGDVNQTHTGALETSDDKRPEDQSYFDEYTFSTTQGAQIDITMTSTEFDSYLIVSGPSGQEFGQNDDMAPGNLNAQVTGVAPEGGTYTVVANSAQADEVGAYTLTIRATKAP